MFSWKKSAAKENPGVLPKELAFLNDDPTVDDFTADLPPDDDGEMDDADLENDPQLLVRQG